MTATTRTQTGAAAFLIGGGLLIVALLFPGFLTGALGDSAAADVQADISEQLCSTQYYALDPADLNKPAPGKETDGSFGTPVTVRGEDNVKAELKERRTCGQNGTFDPALTAALYAHWSSFGLTSRDVKETTAAIDAFTAEIMADDKLYGATVTELEKLEGESTYSEAAVAEGVWSLYMVPDGNGGVDVRVGQTSTKGVNAVFTHPSGAVVKYRLDCGFQPNRDTGFPDVDKCTGTECAPPPVCDRPNTTPWPECNNLKFITPTTEEPGWNVRGRDGHYTENGQESADQIRSGDTRGEAVNDQVRNETGTTRDTVKSEDGGPVAGGGTVLPPAEVEIREDAPEDGIGTQDDNGTGGVKCVEDAEMGITC